jgi:hypothetical protein
VGGYVLADKGVSALTGGVVVLEEGVLAQVVDLLELLLTQQLRGNAHGRLEVQLDAHLALLPLHPVQFRHRLRDLLLFQLTYDVFDVLRLRLETFQLLQLTLHPQLLTLPALHLLLGGLRDRRVAFAEDDVLDRRLVLDSLLELVEDGLKQVVALLHLAFQPADLLTDLVIAVVVLFLQEFA